MVRNIALQIVIFVIIFNLFSWYKESSMLETDTPLTNEPIMLNTIMDEKVSLSSNKNKTVIYFFAPWCDICHMSIDNLQEFYLENQDINVVAVALDYVEEAEIIEFSKDHQLTFPVALGNEQIKQQFNITAYPSYYIIDENNMIIKRSLGYSTKIGMYLRTL